MKRIVSLVALAAIGTSLAGELLENLAAGKPYWLSLPLNYKLCTDAGDAAQPISGFGYNLGDGFEGWGAPRDRDTPDRVRARTVSRR